MAGIGHPLVSLIPCKDKGVRLIMTKAFNDHSEYTLQELQILTPHQESLIMTEKTQLNASILRKTTGGICLSVR